MFQNSHWWCAAVEQWNQRNFFYHRLCHLVPITPLHQSSQRPGNPGRSVVLSTDTLPPSFPSPLLSSSLLSLCFTTVSHGYYYLFFAILEEKISFIYPFRCFFSHSPLLNCIYFALLPSHFVFFFFFCTLSPYLPTPIPSKWNPISLARTPQAAVSVYPLSFLLPPFLQHLTFVQPLISDYVSNKS